jgi:sec-independent protein translocase protein TatC
MAATLVVAMIVAFIFRAQLFALFEWPLHQAGLNSKEILRYQSFVEAFTAAISLAFYVGIIVSMPILLYFLGEFVLPALTGKEKKAVLPALVVGFVLFLGGATFCFIEILPRTLLWLNEFAKDSGIGIISDAKAYFGLVAQLCIAFGLLCELPVIMVTLNVIGIVSYQWLSGTRVYALAGVFVLAAVVSPTSDLITLFLLAGPIAILYEICIWIVWYLDKRRAAADAAYEAQLNRPYDDKPPDEPID